MSYPSTLETVPQPGPTTEMDDTGFEHDVLHTRTSQLLLLLQQEIGTTDPADGTLRARVADLEASSNLHVTGALVGSFTEEDPGDVDIDAVGAAIPNGGALVDDRLWVQAADGTVKLRAPRDLVYTTDSADGTLSPNDADIVDVVSGTPDEDGNYTVELDPPDPEENQCFVVRNCTDGILHVMGDIDGGTVFDLPAKVVTDGQADVRHAMFFWKPDAEEWGVVGRVDPAERIERLQYALGGEAATVTAGAAKLTIRMPMAMRLTELPRLSATTPSSSGPVVVDINEEGVSILSTKLSLDEDEKSSMSATTPAVLSDIYLADDAEITFDVDDAGTDVTGLKVTLIGAPV